MYLVKKYPFELCVQNVMSTLFWTLKTGYKLNRLGTFSMKQREEHVLKSLLLWLVISNAHLIWVYLHKRLA